MSHSEEYEQLRLLSIFDELDDGDEIPEEVLELIQELLDD